MVVMWLFCWVFRRLFVLWIFKLCMVIVNFVFILLNFLIVCNCLWVLGLICLWGLIKRYVKVWCLYWLICFFNWCKLDSLWWFVLLIKMVLVLGILSLFLMIVVVSKMLIFWLMNFVIIDFNLFLFICLCLILIEVLGRMYCSWLWMRWMLLIWLWMK